MSISVVCKSHLEMLSFITWQKSLLVDVSFCFKSVCPEKYRK